MSKTLQKGFTLIELLVVIAIIGILAAVVLVAINPAERIAEANDSKTKSNIGQVATALESCFTANSGSYTNCSTTAGLSTAGYLKTDLSSSVTVKTTAAGDNAIAYGNMTAVSNITGGVKCTSTQSSWMVYHTSTGATDAKGAACVTSTIGFCNSESIFQSASGASFSFENS